MNFMTRRLMKIAAAAAFLAAVIFAAILIAPPSAHRIENRAVYAFVRKVTYEEGEHSKIAKYAPEDRERQDRPAPFAVKFPATDGEVRLRLFGEEGKYHPADSRTLSADGASGQMLVTNLYPDTAYTYTVESDEGQLVQGSFATRGQVRMLDIDGVYNVRDLGGWETASGGRLLYGRIFRGSELSGEHGFAITAEGVRALRDAGVGFELDLRRDDEVNLEGTGESPIAGSVLGEGVGYERIPIEDYLKPWTGEGSDPSGREAYCEALRCIFKCVREGVPVYIHCWGGADRTGTLCLLIEGLLGVSESDLTKEYELTSFAQKFGRRSNNLEDFGVMMAYIRGLEGGTPAERFESFFLELGFSEGEIEEFREKMVA